MKLINRLIAILIDKPITDLSSSDYEQLALAAANALLISNAARKEVELLLLFVSDELALLTSGSRVRKLSPDRDSAIGWLKRAISGAKGLGVRVYRRIEVNEFIEYATRSYNVKLLIGDKGDYLERVLELIKDDACGGVAVVITLSGVELDFRNKWINARLTLDLPLWGRVAVINMLIDEVEPKCSQSY